MKIPLDDKHILCSEENCCWIMQTVTPEKGKPYERRVSGYVPTFEMAVVSYINKIVNSSEASSISQLAEEIFDLKQEVRGWQGKA